MKKMAVPSECFAGSTQSMVKELKTLPFGVLLL
jgi:hypothetical protein